MRALHPWINFNGNALEAFTFYKSVFGGEFTKMVTFGDLSSAEFPVPESEVKKSCISLSRSGKIICSWEMMSQSSWGE
jgi:uncharacterized glyoxalase superfamily protein PhnB